VYIILRKLSSSNDLEFCTQRGGMGGHGSCSASVNEDQVRVAFSI
jgi:hypothetical protein